MPAAPDLDYQALFRGLPDSYLLLAPDGTILDNSDQHVAASLLPRERSAGRDIFDAYPSAPESQRQLRASHDYVRAHRQPHTMELLRYDLERPAETGGGTEERYWEVTHYPILDAAGELQYILQRPQDVTTRVRAEHASAASEMALVEQHDFYEFVLDTLPLIVWTSPPNGRATYFNKGWYDFTGQAPTADPGLLGADTFVHPDDAAGVQAAWQRAATSGTTCQFEYRLRRRDGEYRWLLARVAPRFDDAGKLALWVGCATDIHNQRVLVQEMEAAAEAQLLIAEQAYQAKLTARHQRDTFYGLFQQAPAMICVLRGPGHVYEFVNPGYQSAFPGRQLVGLTVAEALPEVVDQGIMALLDGVYRTGDSFYGNELPVAFTTDGDQREERFFNFIYKRFHEADGTVAGILVFAFEVTELVRTRQHLEKLAAPHDGRPQPDA